MTPEVVSDNAWYQGLVNELRSLVVEARTASAWTIIVAYHHMGHQILDRKADFERRGVKEDAMCEKVAKSIGINRQYVYDAVKFAKMYPEINMFPGDKSLTWNRLRETYLLTEAQKKEKKDKLCPKCGFNLSEKK